jgi:hypothetical protein
MIITIIFGIINSTVYIISQAIEVITRDSLDGYFNIFGMILVILSLLLILTNIQSLFFHIKIIKSHTPKKIEIDTIDDQFINAEKWDIQKFPSYFLRTSNLIFAITYIIYSPVVLLHFIFNDYESEFLIYHVILDVSIMLCGVILCIDAFKIKMQATTLTKLNIPPE